MAVERSIDQVIYVSTFTGVKSAGVISPGSVGYDINCGVRLIQTKRINNIHFKKEHSNVITSMTWDRESVFARINLYKQMKELAIYNTKIK